MPHKRPDSFFSLNLICITLPATVFGLTLAWFMHSLPEPTLPSYKTAYLPSATTYTSDYDYQVIKTGMSTKEFSKANAFDMLNRTSDARLAQYLSFLVSNKQALAQLNQRQFAVRALTELYEPSSIDAPLGKISISTSRDYTDTDTQLTSIDSDTKLYAHIKSAPSVHAGQVFIKWQHVHTGEVMLYKMKPVDASSHYNWVSLIPTDGWRAGEYEVAYYRFTSALEPIASHRFHIDHVARERDDDAVFEDLGINSDDIPSNMPDIEDGAPEPQEPLILQQL